MAAVSTPMNVEPSLPKERADQDQPPKSYADAVISGDGEHSQDRHPSVSGTSSVTAVDESSPRLRFEEGKQAFERYTSFDESGTLTSIRPTVGNDERLSHNTSAAHRRRGPGHRPQSPLESGRKAGAGWHRSA
jgi:hypothetical protein